MKSRKAIPVVAGVFLFLILLLLLFNPWNWPDREGRSVAIRSMKDVDRIVLVDPYNSVELIRVEDGWYLFGTEEVNPVSMENLLIAASRLEVASVVDAEQARGYEDPQGESRELAFFRDDRLLLSYGLRKAMGGYLLSPQGSEQAYFVSVPGYPGLDLERVFSATPDHYRDHLLMDLPPSGISGIKIALLSGEAFRFTQDREGNIRCEPGNEHTKLPEGEARELSMKLLFSYFTSLRYERRTGISADSLLRSGDHVEKLASIRVETFQGEQHSLQIFPYSEIPGSEPDLFRALVLYNDMQDAMIVNYIYLDVLMRGLSHYFREK
ncbi:MAG: hypothetical protein P1P86_12305 [Bacteroidales bacterium]|nr:hypothetical protein [Bacteroidales bacterium]